MGYIDVFGDIGRGDIATVGGKGANLGELFRAGLPVPPGFVLNTSAYRDFVDTNSLTAGILNAAAVPDGAPPQAYEDASRRIQGLFAQGAMPAPMADELRTAYQLLCRGSGGDMPVAVRSSATAEDLASASFAGQQDTYLNVSGADAVVAAAVDCWASLWTARAIAYRSREGIAPETVRLAVVVQLMVEADAAGVMFTANPSNGRRDQTMVSAAWGLGESVVSGTVATDDVVLDSVTGNVLERRTAEKKVMTVYAGAGTSEEPVPLAQRGQVVLDDAAATMLAALGAIIQSHFGVPQDIEWALAGSEFFIVQSRPITSLPEPTGDIPTRWPVPYSGGMYFRASIVEQLPDPLSPLFADLIDGSVTRSLNTLIINAFGRSALRPGDVALPTINGYAYYYYRNAGMWRLMGKSLGAVGRLARGKADLGIKGWKEHSHPRYAAAVAEWTYKPVPEMSGEELFAGASALLDAGTEYYTAVQSIIPIAATSEIAFSGFYTKLVQRAGDPPAQTFLLGYDSEPIRAEKSLYDLAAWTLARPALAAAILETPSAEVAKWLDTGAPAGDPAGLSEWCSRFEAHLERYGHAVYNLDFFNAVPADDPAPLLETVKFYFYLRGQGQYPYERQAATADRREQLARTTAARLDRARRATFTKLLHWAQRAAPVREDALADIGLAWPAMRRMLLELGRRLSASGVLAQPADVFWLRAQELRSAIDFGLVDPPTGSGNEAAGEPSAVSITGVGRPVRADAVEERKMVWRGQRRATAPQLLPANQWMQRTFASYMPAGSQDQTGDVISGVGASGGLVTARARNLAGPEDFSSMKPGEVLVARMTTPAWTSLFTMASAVVTDVGGPLSHSSIVAREYGIPAVLGTGVATQRIASGKLVRVDGDAGTVGLVQEAASAGVNGTGA